MKKIFLLLILSLSFAAQAQHGNFTDIRLIKGSSTLAGTNDGTIYFDPGLVVFRFRQGGSWLTLGGGSGYATIQDHGSSLTQRANLNAINGLTAVDDSGNTRTNIGLGGTFASDISIYGPSNNFSIASKNFTVTTTGAGLGADGNMDLISTSSTGVAGYVRMIANDGTGQKAYGAVASPFASTLQIFAANTSNGFNYAQEEITPTKISLATGAGSTNPTERLAINLTGGWTVSGTTGTNGQVLTTNGSSVPTWVSPFITSITTTGTSGAATVVSGVLNVPQYATGSPAWLLASGGTLTGVNTVTSNQANGLNYTSTFTATASTDYAYKFAGTQTANSGGGVTAVMINPAMVASGTSSLQIGLDVNPSFSGGTTPNHVALRAGFGGGATLIGPNATSILNGEIFQIRRDANNGNYLMMANNTSGTAATTGIFMYSNGLSTFSLLVAVSTGFSSSGIYQAGKAVWSSTLANGMNLGTTVATPLQLWTNNVSRVTIDASGSTTITQGVMTSAWAAAMTVNPGSHTGITASTELSSQLNNTFTYQWATGTLATERFNWYKSPTVSFVGASTLTNGYNVYIDPLVAGTNATITNSYALGVNGNMNLIGNLYISGSKGNSGDVLTNTSGTIGWAAPTGGGSGWSLSAASTITGNTSQAGSFTNTAGFTSNIWTQPAMSSGWLSATVNNYGAHTGMTASTEFNNWIIGTVTQQWATGALTTERSNWIKSPTLAFVSGSTVTSAYNLYIDAPIAGTNATITNNYALGINGNAQVSGFVYGSSGLSGARVQIGGSTFLYQDISTGYGWLFSTNTLTGNNSGVTSNITGTDENTVAGSALSLRGGNTLFTNANGGNLILSGGAGNGTGVSGNVKINTASVFAIGGATITSGSILADFQSTTLGILVPRVTNVASVSTPVNGMIVYDAATNLFNFRENGSWTTSLVAFSTTSLGYVTASGSSVATLLGNNTWVAPTAAGQSLRYNGTTTAWSVYEQVGTYSASATLPLTQKYISFTGSTASQTLTLPAISGNTGKDYIIKNRSSVTMTVSGPAANTLYTTTAVTTVTLNAGDSMIFSNDGTYYTIN